MSIEKIYILKTWILNTQIFFQIDWKDTIFSTNFTLKYMEKLGTQQINGEWEYSSTLSGTKLYSQYINNIN